MPTSDYHPNSPNCTAYKWNETVTGDQRDKTPTDRGKVPSDIISEGVEMNATEKNTVSTDDDNFVKASAIGDVADTTLRGAIMSKFQISESESLVTQLDQLLRGAHVNISGVCKHYLWNFETSSWYYLGDDIAGYLKDTHESQITLSPEDYVSASIIYFLQWDFSGWYNSGGCVRGDTPLKTPQGIKTIFDVKLGDEIFTNVDGKIVKTRVIGKTLHWGRWLLHRYKGLFFTGDHEIKVNGKWVEARKLSDRKVHYEGIMCDLVTEIGRSYYSANEVLIHNKQIMKW